MIMLGAAAQAAACLKAPTHLTVEAGLIAAVDLDLRLVVETTTVGLYQQIHLTLLATENQ